jgi:hypothetical protein
MITDSASTGPKVRFKDSRNGLYFNELNSDIEKELADLPDIDPASLHLRQTCIRDQSANDSRLDKILCRPEARIVSKQLRSPMSVNSGFSAALFITPPKLDLCN